MSENETDAARALLRTAEEVYGEYDQGYLDADAALRRLRPAVEELRGAIEE
jgi:hypothetical protein